MGTAACFLIVLPIVSGAIPQSRSDRGDGHRLGGGFAVGKRGRIDALATKQSPGLFLPNANAFGASCLLHCVQFTHRTLQIFNLSASLVKGDSPLCGEMSRNDRGDGRRLGAIVFLPQRG